MTFTIKMRDAHLYYAGEEIDIRYKNDSIMTEVVSIRGDYVTFKAVENKRSIIEELREQDRLSHQ